MVSRYIWKLLIRNEALLANRITTAMSPAPSFTWSPRFFPLGVKSNFRIPNFCTDVTPPTASEKGIVTEFLLTKCGLTEKNITKAFRHCNRLLNAKSIENSENVLELLKQCGLTLAQIRSVVICNPGLMFLNAEKNLQPKVAFLRSFMEERDLAKFIAANSRAFNLNLERRLKPAVEFLRESGFEGRVLSRLLAKQPRLLTISNQKVVESFKQAEDFGFKKGSNMFAVAMQLIIAIGKDNLDRKLQFLKNLGLSEQEVLKLCKLMPRILVCSEKKLKRNVDFAVNSVQLPTSVIAKYPALLTSNLETRIMPRHRVVVALKSMQVLKKERVFPQIVMMTEELFLEKYINSYDEASALLDIYKGGNEGGPSLQNEI